VKYLVAVDFSESMQKILDNVQVCIRKEDDEVWLLHVAEPDPEFVGYEVDTVQMRQVTAQRYQQEMCDLEAVEKEFKEQGISCKALLIQGSIAETILREAEKLDIDMLVLGSHGKNCMESALLGSTSMKIVHLSALPMLIVPTHQSV
jgi:nucleotide-binding universal stress UspA family protein